MKSKFKLLPLLAIPIIAMAGLFTGTAKAYSFNQNNIIDDKVFNQSGTMDTTAINNFLNSLPSSCISPNHGFSAPDPTGYNPTNGFLYGGNVTAGQVIYDAAQAYEINPQVLLTTLQKEQSLVDGGAGCSTLGYAAAMGYGCPDSGTTHNYSGVDLYTLNGTTVTSVNGTCVSSSLQVGFSQQIIHAAWLLEFGMQRSEGNINWAIIKGNWDNSDDPQSCYNGPMTQGTWVRCPSGSAAYYDGYTTIDGTAVHMDDGATAALYWYTPHFAGNENFFNIFTNWFGSPYFTINITYPVGDDAVDSSGDIAFVPVVLSSPPLSAVQLNFGVSDTSVAKIIENSSMVFSPSNWNVPQYIAVQGLPSSAGSHNFSLEVLYINSPDGAYSQSVTPFLETLPMFWHNMSEQAVYRLYNSTTGKHAYAVNASVVSNLESNGYSMESTLGYQCDGSTNTPLVVDNTNGLVRNLTSSDIPNFENAQPTILFSNTGGSYYITILKNTSGTDTLLSGNSTEVSNAQQSGWTVMTSFLLCKQGDVPVYRLNDRLRNAHFYTASATELDSLIPYGLLYEGVTFYVNQNDTLPVYRLYDPANNTHFYTASQAESTNAQSVGYRLEGVAFNSGASSGPVYRLYDPTSDTHFYTSSQAEFNYVQGLGFKNEGVAFDLN